jgi:hypothetical protein
MLRLAFGTQQGASHTVGAFSEFEQLSSIGGVMYTDGRLVARSPS